MRRELPRTVEDIVARCSCFIQLDAAASMEATRSVDQLRCIQLGQDDARTTAWAAERETMANGYVTTQ